MHLNEEKKSLPPKLSITLKEQIRTLFKMGLLKGKFRLATARSSRSPSQPPGITDPILEEIPCNLRLCHPDHTAWKQPEAVCLFSIGIA
ncbi:hypothetical protein GDO78_003115 [Eleutherodactylus coqui]|uniref:Uncharacterized protein n=1 Tax=Eleutherodactylus coqui TaxID=57060 RepID=A0A8J6K1Z7_ELECQ|nr:hypothetical protein GDO78_003115 [Eleutherodactylus coqui]